MIISVTHLCGHTSKHVGYGTLQQLARQGETLETTPCPDCFHAKVMRLTAAANRAPAPAVPRHR